MGVFDYLAVQMPLPADPPPPVQPDFQTKDTPEQYLGLADGFGESGYAVLDMCTFWFANHGRGVDEIDFRGVVIAWEPIIPLEPRVAG